MPTATESRVTWTGVIAELPAAAKYASAHGVPRDIGRLLLEGDLSSQELMAPVITAMTPRDGERLLAIVVNPFEKRVDRDRILGSMVVESGSHEIRIVSDVTLALREATTVAAEEILFIRAPSEDTETIVNAIVNHKTSLFKFENRTDRGAVAGVLSPEFLAAFFSSTHDSVEILGRPRAIWSLIQSVSVAAVPA